MWVDRFRAEMKLTRLSIATSLTTRISQCKVSEPVYVFPWIRFLPCCLHIYLQLKYSDRACMT
jgi:hypothetical protein